MYVCLAWFTAHKVYKCMRASSCRNNIAYTSEEIYEFNISINGFVYISHVDMDECILEQSNCSVHANCTNVLGSYLCTCNTGYTGNGFNCSGMISHTAYNCM